MATNTADEIEQSVIVLGREIEKLDGLGLPFATSVVRIALLDLQMRLYGVTLEELDAMGAAASAVQVKRLAREHRGGDRSGRKQDG